MATQFARYVGTAHVRRMTKQNWLAAGIKDQDTVVFNRGNGMSVPRDQFSDAAWNALVLDANIIVTDAAPDAQQIDSAKAVAAEARLRARMAGMSAPKADDIPGVDERNEPAADEA